MAADTLPFVTAATGAYGHAVLSKTSDKASDATVRAGTRILQKVFGHHNNDHGSLPDPVADIIAHLDDEEFLTVLKIAIRKALEKAHERGDDAMLTEIRSILAEAPHGTVTVTQNVTAARDSYTAARDMTIHQRPE